MLDPVAGSAKQTHRDLRYLQRVDATDPVRVGERAEVDKTKLIPAIGAVLVGLLLAGTAAADEATTERRLLEASEGLQMPGSEADSEWWFVSYRDEETLPAADKMAGLTACSDGMTRSDFDATLGRLSQVQPWMDRGQRKSARGFARLQRLFHRRYGDEVAFYRCETGGPQVPIYFVGVNEDGLSGLLTVNIET